MKEYPEERLLIERLWSTFGKDWLSISEIAQFDDCHPRTAKRRYDIKNGGMSIVCLAHRKCEMARK